MDKFGFDAGDVLYIDHTTYQHYGLYIGNGKIIHFSNGDLLNLENPINIKIRETTITNFQNGNKAIVSNNPSRDSVDTIIKRAKNKLGSNFGGYNLITNNCEKFVRWCESGIDEDGYPSEQVFTTYDKIINALDNFRDKMEDFFDKGDEFIDKYL